MIITLGYAKEQLKRYVDSGTCTSARLVSRLNEAVQHLVNVSQPLQNGWMKRRMRVCSRKGYFTLPYDVEAILEATIDRTPADVFRKNYEFIESGPGSMDCCAPIVTSALVDLGDGYPTFFPVDRTDPRTLVAFSTSQDDVGKELTVYGLESDGKEVRVESSFGEKIEIRRWQDGVEGSLIPSIPEPGTAEFAQIDRVVKPVTTGYVSLYTYDPDYQVKHFLAKYHPDETYPGYRRYRITASDVAEEDRRLLVFLVLLRFVPMTRDDDVVLVQNIPALKAMLQALSEYDAQNFTAAVAYETQALRHLLGQFRRMEPRETAMIVTGDFALGEVDNME